MSANIDSYMGRQSAWHNLGTVTGNYMSWEDIQNSGNLNYGVEKRQLQHEGVDVPVWATFRTDNNACFGGVGEDYQVIHHSEGFQQLDGLVSANNGSHYETAGSLGKGEVVWGLIDLSVTTNVGRDESKNYLLFSTAHDGSMSHSFRLTNTRVVCQNTLSIATKSAALLAVRHTKNAQKRIDNLNKAIGTIHGELGTLAMRLNFLAGKKATRETTAEIMDRLFPKVQKDGKDQDSTRRTNIIGDILARYEYNDGDAYPEQRGTAYNLLNAITEYTDHYRGSDPEKRSLNSMFGSGDTLKSKALEVITLTANGMPSHDTRVIYTTSPFETVTTATPHLDEILGGLD